MSSMTAPSELATLADELRETALYAEGDLESVLVRAATTIDRLAASPSAMKEACKQIALDHTPAKFDGTLAAHVVGMTIAAAIDAIDVAALASLDAPAKEAVAPAAGGDELTPAQISIANDMFKAWVDDPKFRQAFRDDCKRLVDAPPLQAPAYSDAVREALKPFADAAASYDDIPGVSKTHGNVELWQQPNRDGYRLTVDHLRNARAALTAPAAKAPAASWTVPTETVADLISNLRTIDPALKVHGAYHIDTPNDRCRARNVSMSLERVSGNRIRTGDESVPYSLVIWTQPDFAPAVSEADVGRARWRHKKRGSTYTEVGRGKVQSEHWRDPNVDGDYDTQTVDMREVVVYRADSDGGIWVRPVEEFNDGRFELIQSAAQGGGTEGGEV